MRKRKTFALLILAFTALSLALAARYLVPRGSATCLTPMEFLERVQLPSLWMYGRLNEQKMNNYRQLPAASLAARYTTLHPSNSQK